MKTKCKCAARGSGKSGLVAAIAVLAIAFVLLAAVPVAEVSGDDTPQTVSTLEELKTSLGTNASTLIDVGTTINVGVGETVTVPNGKTLIINGTLSIDGGALNGAGTVRGSANSIIMMTGGNLSGVTIDATGAIGGAVEVSTTNVSSITIEDLKIIITNSEAEVDRGIYVNPVPNTVTVQNIEFDFNGNDAVPVNTDITQASNQILKNFTYKNVNKVFKTLVYATEENISIGDNLSIVGVSDVCLWSEGSLSSPFKITQDVTFDKSMTFYNGLFTVQSGKTLKMADSTVLTVKAGAVLAVDGTLSLGDGAGLVLAKTDRNDGKYSFLAASAGGKIILGKGAMLDIQDLMWKYDGATTNQVVKLTAQNDSLTVTFDQAMAYGYIKEATVSGNGIGKIEGVFPLVYDSTPGNTSAGKLNIKAKVEGNIILGSSEELKPSIVISEGGVYSGTIVQADYTGSYPQWTAEVQASADIKNLKAATDKSVTVKAGSLIIGGTPVVIDSTTTSIVITEGTAVVDSGGFVLPPGVILTVESGVTLDVQGELEVQPGAKVSVAGTMSTSGIGDVKNNGVVESTGRGDVSGATFSDDSTGTVTDATDDSDMDEVTIKGRIKGTENRYDKDQIVTIGEDSVLVEGAKLEIKGKLVIPLGVTLTIEAGAQLVLDEGAKFVVEGNLVIEEKTETLTEAVGLHVKKGEVKLSGSIMTSREIKLDVGSIEVLADGILTVTEAGTMNVATGSTFTVNDSGTLIVNGKLSGKVYNAGIVIYDSSVGATASPEIEMKSAGALVDVIKFTAGVGSIQTLTITDKTLVMSSYMDSATRQTVNVTDFGNSDKVEIKPVKGGTIGAEANYALSVSGLMIESKVSTVTSKTDQPTTGYNKVTDKQYVKSMDISGTLSASIALVGTATAGSGDDLFGKADVTLSHDGTARVSFAIAGMLSVSENTTVVNEGTLKVTGTVATSSDKASFDNKDASTGSIEITSQGEVSLVKNTLTGKVKATKYTISAKDASGTEVKTNHYANIDKALQAVSAAGSDIKELTLVGDQTISASAELPAGVVLDIGANTLNINKSGEEIIFSVASGATVKGTTGKIVVSDTLYVVDKRNMKVSDAKIEADVKTEEVGEDGKALKNGWARWTNLSVALSEATPGSVISITRAEVKVESNITIAEGVTVELPATSTMLLESGVTLTIDGVLKADGAIKAKSAFDLTAAKVANTLPSTDPIGNGKYSSAVVVNGKLMSAGAVKYDDGTYTKKESATPFEFSTGAPVAGLYYTEGSYGIIAGIDTALADVSKVVGDIKVHGKVSGGDYIVESTTGFYKLVVSGDEVKSGVFGGIGTPIETSLTVKSLTLDGVTFDVEDKGYFTGAVAIGDAVVTASHASKFTYNVSGTKAYLSGAPVITGKGDSLVISAGKVYTGDITEVKVRETLGEETALIVASGAELAVDKAINGVERIIVDGTLTVPSAKTMTAIYMQVNGAVSVAAATATSSAGTLTVKDLYVGVEQASIGADATFNGPVKVSSGGKIVVGSKASFDTAFAACLDSMRSTAFIVDGSVWFTAYANDASVKVTVSMLPKENVAPAGWSATAGGAAIMASSGNVVETIFDIGEPSMLYALYKTEIYTIIIKADEGIADIYLNGQAMSQGMVIGEEFSYYAYSSVVSAGAYKVTYTLKNGYSGTATLSKDGTALSDNSFTMSGKAGTFVYQLSGIEKSGYVDPVEPEKKVEGLTITEILLIVLVILVVIMAVVVALRLMRS